MATELEIDPYFLDFLKLLNQHEVRYVVIGGYAVNFHGYVRGTLDFDVFVEISESNADRLVEVFKEFGFDAPELNRKLFLEAGNIIRLGVPPVRLEVLNRISGVEFDDCYQQRVLHPIAGVPVNFISRELLIQNKLASGRDKDLDDAKRLQKLTEPQQPGSKTKKPKKSAPRKKRRSN